ncbi:hypothetical protein L0U85_10420 [Glycomyces sp. L485]|uniref:hypothetical protein n=1 Tax=Glycomyces sp. L485 TaxID=2909235 RepID=UPI001F4A24A7|nr:hypothetical protein [Glycomyces sp. L485]MCH7231263.1 hypothetical protein [Glycomyces sp. L485]
MSDDLEDLLRAELAGRAGTVSPSYTDGLADAAISGARRIRRRRRVGAAAGGLGLIVLGAAVAVWTPWTGGGLTDAPPAATSAEEVQNELSVEFVVERDGGYGIVNTDDEFIPLNIEDEPVSAERLQDAYVVTGAESVNLVTLDGATVNPYEAVAGDERELLVRGDGQGFAVSYPNADVTRLMHEMYPGRVFDEPEGPMVLDLAFDVVLRDWSDDVVLLAADLSSVNGGAAGGPYNFNAEFDYGLESVAAAGYEAAILADTSEPNYLCVSDLEPGNVDVGSEQCGYLGDDETAPMIVEASRDETAPDMVAEYNDTWFGDADGGGLTDPGTFSQELTVRDHYYMDPNGRWQLGYGSGDQTWTLLDTSGEDAFVSELTPPEGALFPVLSHN